MSPKVWCKSCWFVYVINCCQPFKLRKENTEYVERFGLFCNLTCTYVSNDFAE